MDATIPDGTAPTTPLPEVSGTATPAPAPRVVEMVLEMPPENVTVLDGVSARVFVVGCVFAVVAVALIFHFKKNASDVEPG